MADSFDLDVSEVRDLSVRLGRLPVALVAPARAVVKKGAQNIKDDTRANLPGRWWGRLERTVSYDVQGLGAEVGYEDRGQGELAGIYEFGSARRDPHPTLYPAAGRELPRFERALLDAAEKVARDVL